VVVDDTGGIERYLDAFPDGGLFKGKNFVFDERVVHPNSVRRGSGSIVGRCHLCEASFDSYQARHRCTRCRLLLLVCPACAEGMTALSKRDTVTDGTTAAQMSECREPQLLEKPAERDELDLGQTRRVTSLDRVHHRFVHEQGTAHITKASPQFALLCDFCDPRRKGNNSDVKTTPVALHKVRLVILLKVLPIVVTM
jgi:hypothetical protein